MSCLLPFEKLQNTRDLVGMKTLEGREILPGRLIRSGHLGELSLSDTEKLSVLVSVIIDLRSDMEISEQPDKRVPGTENIHISVVDNLTAGITREKNADRDIFGKFMLDPLAARQYMCDMYKNFMTDSAIEKYAVFVKELLKPHDKAVLWHCTAGKDRAGIASVIVEEILGVQRDEIILDYLRTNDYLKLDFDILIGIGVIKAAIDDDRAKESLGFLLGAKREYLEAFYREVDQRFGNMEAFIRDGLHLKKEDIESLKTMYLS
jgi:protein-tyrosine phosphatase